MMERLIAYCGLDCGKCEARRATLEDDDALRSTLRRWGGASSAGREIILVDPKGTSQTCSMCGETVKKDLSVRVHECPHCNRCSLNRLNRR